MKGHNGRDHLMRRALPRNDVTVLPGSDVTIVANDIGAVGGMERVLTELVSGLCDRGHRVTVIARTYAPAAREGISFHRVPGPRRPFLLAYPWFVIAGTLAVWRSGRGVVQSTGAIVLNRVDVIHVHYCHQVGPVNPSRSTALFRLHAALVRLVKRLSERASYQANRPATFVCVSDGVADELREHFPALRPRVMTIHNGVDTDAFAPGVRHDEAIELRRSLAIGDERLVAAFVGSEWERKGLRLLIEALPSSPEWDVVVAGDGDRRHYQELADRLGVGGAMHWLGVRSDVQLVYELADAFVFPSAYETFSLVTFEAAASGLPIIGTPVNGVRELLRDGQNGFLVAPAPGPIAARLRELAADPALRARMGAAARESALEFTWERMVVEHERLYARLAGAHRR